MTVALNQGVWPSELNLSSLKSGMWGPLWGYSMLARRSGHPGSAFSFIPLCTSCFCGRGIHNPEVFRLPSAGGPGALWGPHYSLLSAVCLQQSPNLGPTPSPAESELCFLSYFKSWRCPDNHTSRHLWRAYYVLGSVSRAFVLCLDSFSSHSSPTREALSFSGRRRTGGSSGNEATRAESVS